MLFQVIGGVFLSVPTQQAQASPSDWLTGYSYRTPVLIDNNNETALTDYQTKITLQGTNPAASNYIDFDKVLPNGADLRITDSDKTTQLSYWIEEWNDTNKTATVWVKVPTLPTTSQTQPYFLFTVSQTNHDDYGLSYPITYEFNIPSNSTSLKAYKKYTKDGEWTQIEEKTSNDFFNGIEAVRYDYPNNKAYVSAAFDANSNDLYLKITDINDNQVGAYQQMDKYYDNRKAAVTTSGDDWDVDKNTVFESACDMLASKRIWFTPGIITARISTAVYWNAIQSKIDAGYIEPASHTRNHAANLDTGLFIPYSDYVSEIDGSKQDLINNLNLPAFSKKGSTEYVYSFIAPGGASDNAARQQLGISKYLVDRDVSIDSVSALWDYTNGLYGRIGYSIRMGTDGTTNLAILNNAFDTVYNNGGIYHLMTHPLYVDWSSGSYADQHTTYISGKKDIWYAGLGHLYLYNYTREKAAQRLASLGNSLYLYYGKANDTNSSNYNTTFTKDYNESGLVGLWHMDEGTLGSELLIDGGMEAWTNATTLTNWTSDSSSVGVRDVTQETTNKQGGNYALKLAATANNGTNFGVYQNIATISNQTYQVNLYQYLSSRTAGTLKLETWDNTNNVSLGSQSITTGTALSFASFRFTSTNTTSVRIKIYLNGETTSGTAYIDTISVKQSPSTLTDSSASSNTGTIYGASRTDTDGGQWGSRSDIKFGQGSALQFDGEDDYASVDMLNFTENTSFSMQAWVILSSTGKGRGGVIVSGDLGNSYGIDKALNNVLEFGIRGTLGLAIAQTEALNYEQWYYIIGVYNAKSTVAIYVNGNLAGTADASNMGTFTSEAITIGGDNVIAGTPYYFDGTIDEARMYNRVLSAEEISAQYQRSKYAPFSPSTSLSSLQTPSTYFTNTSNIISSSNNYLTYSTEPTPGNEISSSLSLTPPSGYLLLDINNTTANINYQNSAFPNLTASNIDRETNFNHNGTTSLKINPSSGTIDLNINTWHTSTDYYKKWTESSTTHDLTTSHTIGDLQPNVRYILKVDGQASDTYVANDQGQISFTYNSGYSTKTFELEETPSSSFIAPSKPSVSNLDITNNNGTLSLDNLPTTITQIAISNNPDFTNSSWEDISKKDDLLKQYTNTDTLYIKFRTQEGGVSDTIIKEGNNITGNEQGTPSDNVNDNNIDTNNSNQSLQDGDLIKTPNNPDVYVIKYKNNKQYKRLLLSPTIFNSYLHLKWNNIKTISQQQSDQYQTSNLVKEATDTVIYTLTPNGDTGKRKPLNPSTPYDPDSIYEINKPERDSYELED